jgi:hypothetical protein
VNTLLFLLILVFIIINIVQTRLIFSYKLLVKGGLIIGAIEAGEIPLIIYLILEGKIIGFLVVIFGEIIQWSIIAYFATKSTIK